jgi:hypothetical protein
VNENEDTQLRDSDNLPPEEHQPIFTQNTRRFTATVDNPEDTWSIEINKVNLPARRYLPNAIKTSKYTWLTFVPKNLLEQFSKMANIYFLFIMVLQVIPPISISGG